MKAYRRRFITLNLVIIGMILLVMLIGVAIYMYRDYCDNLEDTMKQLLQPLSSTPSETDALPPDAKESSLPPEKPKKPEKVRVSESRQKDIMTVFYNSDTGHISIQSQAGLIEDDMLAMILEAVTEQSDSYGALEDYGILYYRSGRTDPYRIALTSTSYIGNSMRKLIVILMGIWLGAMLCFFVLAYYISALAVRPLEESIRRERQFIADVSHDLNTPVSVILANNSILKENPQNTISSQLRWIESTGASAEQMRTLISEMLMLSEVENPEIPLSYETIDLSGLAAKAVLQIESIAYDKEVTLTAEIADHVILSSNGNYLLRVMTSLLENAVKYEPAGGSVRFSLTATKRRVKIEVRNRNSVIAREDLPHVFERFYRTDHSRREHSGHGLGLSIVKQIVQRLGGTVSAESNEEEGAVFRVLLPH